MRCSWSLLIFLAATHSLVPANLRGLTVAINAGHNRPVDPRQLRNGDGIGAYSVIGRIKMRFPGHPLSVKKGPWRGVIRESDLVQDLARRLAGRCRRLGARVVFARVEPCTATPTGRYRNLRARARRVNSSGADVLIDLHANAGQPAGPGYMLFVPVPGKHLVEYRFGRLPKKNHPAWRNGKFTVSYRLAGALDAKLLDLAKRGGVRPYPGPRIYGSGFKVIGFSRVPGVLIEVGAMDRPEDMDKLVDAGYRERLAAALAGGILRWRAEMLRKGKP